MPAMVQILMQAAAFRQTHVMRVTIEHKFTSFLQIDAV